MPERQPDPYDVIVVGAGPAGCEAALAAATAGARVLCLTINLDNVGFPPANPIIAGGSDDNRLRLLEEVENLGGRLPGLLARDGIGLRLPDGILCADRRLLGLAYKELLETTDAVQLRQTLVTCLEKNGGRWLVSTRLDEHFAAAAVVLAAGTFLRGEVDDGGIRTGSGRLGEIPSNALADSIGSLGVELVAIEAVNMPRVSTDSVPRDDGSFRAGGYRFLPDGSQLSEQYMFGPYLRGSRAMQLESVRRIIGNEGAWVTRAAWSISCLALAAGQVDKYLQCVSQPGLYFAGRAAAGCNYTEAAATGLVAGLGAAALALGEPGIDVLIKHTKFVSELCELISQREERPVTIRVSGTGC